MLLKDITIFFKEKLKESFQSQGVLAGQIRLFQFGQLVVLLLAFGITAWWFAAENQLVGPFQGLAILALHFVLIYRLQGRVKYLRHVQEVKANWGKEIKRERDFTLIAEYFQARREGAEFVIDDRTWADLDMDLVYGKLDRTATVPGEQYLYNLLRTPEFDLEKLRERNRLVNKFHSDSELREKLQVILTKVGKSGGEGIFFCLSNPLPAQKSIWFYRILTLLSVVSIGLTLWKPFYWLFFIPPIFAVNMFFHYREKRHIARYLGILFYLGRFLTGVKELTKYQTKDPLIKKYQQELAKALHPFRKTGKQTALFQLQGGVDDSMVEYGFILFLYQVRTFYQVLETIYQHRDQLQRMYELVGEMDALMSIASYRTGLDYYCEPELATGEALMVEGIYHPLLKQPVSNSFHLTRKGMLLTGSNMSGKSTLLRAVGVNVLLAQTIYTCLAEKYQGDYYQLMTSIGRSDNVVSGDSYYLVEAKALLRVIQQTEGGGATLCIVDEIFRGTNSQERISASAEVLRYLAESKCTLFAATHDLELTDILADVMENYHFQETVNEHGLSFDYQLKAGPSTSRNAIHLLNYLGYPNQIVQAARERMVEEFAVADKIG